jgi:hypothetical protein
MSKKLAIKGHPTRGKEVIELLEMFGGHNVCRLNGREQLPHWVADNNYICNKFSDSENCRDILLTFTLEEFLEKYPFKIGDKVIDEADGCPGVVCEMKWDEYLSDMKYCVAFGNGVDFGWYANDSIKFFKIKKNENLEETQSNQDIDKVVDIFRKEFCECCGSQRCSGQDDELVHCERFKNLMDNSGKPSVKNHKMGPKSKLPSKYYEDKLEETQSKRDIDKSEFIIKHMILPNKVDDKLEYEIIDGYEFDKVDNNKIILKPIKPKYPITYEECCIAMYGSVAKTYGNCIIKTNNGYKGSLIQSFQRLIFYRDAYWKIAGEEMGLGKPWEPDFGKTVLFDITFYFYQDNFVLHKGEYSSSDNCILVFPTEEIRDAFYENFKDLIEECKKLL